MFVCFLFCFVFCVGGSYCFNSPKLYRLYRSQLYVYFPHYYSLLHGCTVWIFSTNGETQNTVDFVMHRRRLDGHCTGPTGLFLLSLNDKCFALAVGYNQACNFFMLPISWTEWLIDLLCRDEITIACLNNLSVFLLFFIIFYFFSFHICCWCWSCITQSPVFSNYLFSAAVDLCCVQLKLVTCHLQPHTRKNQRKCPLTLKSYFQSQEGLLNSAYDVMSTVNKNNSLKIL